MDSFWSSFWSSIFAGLVLAGGAIVLPIIKAKLPDYFDHFRSGLIGLACTAILIVTFTGRPLFSKKPFHVTEDNVEEIVKMWAENNGVGLTKPNVPQDEGVFNYTLTLPNGLPVMVFKNRSANRIEMQALIQLEEQGQQDINSMNKDDVADVVQAIGITLSQARIANIISFPTPQLRITLRKIILIGSLDESVFMQSLDELDYGATITRNTLSTAIRRKRRDGTGHKSGEDKPNLP